eukprot:jgi/Botrbrau1/3655/Bobra.0204s0045.1
MFACCPSPYCGEGGSGFWPSFDELASLPLSAGGLGILRGCDVLPYSHLASAMQTLPVQDEVLGSWEVPLASALLLAGAGFCGLCPDTQEDSFSDPQFVGFGLQHKLGSLLNEQRRRALLALPAQDRLIEVAESAARPHASEGLQALPEVRFGQTMSAVDFQCRLQFADSLYSQGARCPRGSVVMDRRGKHAVQCRVGAGVANTYSRNAVRDCLLRMAKELQLQVRKEPPLPVQVLGLSTRPPDLVVPDWDNGRDLFLDVVGTSPLPSSYGGDFSPPGGGGGALWLRRLPLRWHLIGLL